MFCPSCHYDLRETPDHCPECGDTFLPDGNQPIPELPPAWWRQQLPWVLLMFLLQAMAAIAMLIAINWRR